MSISLFEHIIVVIVGSILGGFLLGALGVGGTLTGFNIASAGAFIGAVVPLLILRAVHGTARV